MSLRSYSKQRLFSAQEFQEADRLGRIRIHLINPDRFHLTNQEEKYLGRMRRCFTIFTTKYSDAAVDKVLKKEFDTMNSVQLRSLKRDTKRLYGDFVEENKVFAKVTQRERLLRMLHVVKKEKKDGYEDIMVKIEALIMKLEGNDQEFRKEEVRKLPIPKNFKFSSDPKILTQNAGQISDAEIVE